MATVQLSLKRLLGYNTSIRQNSVRQRGKEANHHKASDATQRFDMAILSFIVLHLNDEAYLQVRKSFRFCTEYRAPAATL